MRSRKRTNKEWFETQDTIAYWSDFENPVIVWQRITKENTFCMTEPGFVPLDSMAFLSNFGNDGDFLLSFLNSKIVYFWMKLNVHEYGETGFRLSNQYVEEIPVPAPFTIPQGEDFNQALMEKLELSEEEVEFLTQSSS